MTLAKICGLSTPEAVAAALDGGATFIGFNFFPKSPRYLAAETAARLALPARAGGVKTVAILVEPDDATLDAIMAALEPDLIQLHGSETPERTAEVGRRAGRGVIKALPVSEPADLARAQAYEGAVEHLMFDARPPAGFHMPGGSGARFDWTMLKDKAFARPHFLAGGLDPWNVSEAVRHSGAPMVDVSSGVERGPGLKDPALITAFLDAVRRA